MQVAKGKAQVVVSMLVVSLVVIPAAARAAQSPQVPVKGSLFPKWVDPLPPLETIVDDGTPIVLHMKEFKAQVLPTGFPKTTVWGYLRPGQVDRTSYIGPVIVARRGSPTEVTFVNDLGSAATTGVLAYRYSTDLTLHWADPDGTTATNGCTHQPMPPTFGSACAQNYAGPIPAVPHLHGGEVPPQLDGGPDAWVTSDGLRIGADYYSRAGWTPGQNWMTYRYPNTQESAAIWFHDHTLGATRLNVYAGLAGAYLIQDPVNDPQNLPELVPLVIQDRMFDGQGELFFTADSAGNVLWALNPDHPYWNPEFVGDVVVVNGKAWPYLAVEKKRYTFLFLNGSNARTYEIFLSDPAAIAPPPPMWVIGTDGGYLDAPQPVKKLIVMPGERYQVIIDFAASPAGTNFIVRNTAKTPFPGGGASPASTVGEIMQIRVGGIPAVADGSFDPAVPGTKLRGGAGQGPAVQRLVDPAKGTLAASVTPSKPRQLTLNEVMGMPVVTNNPVTNVISAYPGGPLEILVNNTKWSGQRIALAPDGKLFYENVPGLTPDRLGTSLVSELPTEGTTEVWEIVNTTADAHPIHLHLVQFQLMNRQDFDTKSYAAAYAAAFPGGGWDMLTGLPYPPGVYIPGFGPPLPYDSPQARARGGNPDVAAVNAKGKPVYLRGAPQPPLPHEAGWKDTVVAYPGQVTRIAVRWAPTDAPVGAVASFPFDPASQGYGYVWHCHIIDHEDNEMMRPTQVIPSVAAQRTYVQGTDF